MAFPLYLTLKAIASATRSLSLLHKSNLQNLVCGTARGQDFLKKAFCLNLPVKFQPIQSNILVDSVVGG